MISIPDGNNTYVFYWRGESVPPPERKKGPGDARAFEMTFASPPQARFLLQTLQQTFGYHRLCSSDPLADPTRWSADQVLDHLAQQLVTRRLRVERRWIQMPSGGAAVVEAKVVVPRRSPASSPPPVQDPPTFAPDHDGHSQSEVLAGAAETGVPFCAECLRAEMQAAAAAAAKASQQQSTSPVPPPPAPDKPTFPANDTAAQAQTLMDASAAGVPFCEECARAAEEQAAADAAALATASQQQQSDSPVPPPPPAPPDVPTFAANRDTAAQAQTLMDASAAGVPFCQECAAAAAQTQAAA